MCPDAAAWIIIAGASAVLGAVLAGELERLAALTIAREE